VTNKWCTETLKQTRNSFEQQHPITHLYKKKGRLVERQTCTGNSQYAQKLSYQNVSMLRISKSSAVAERPRNASRHWIFR